MRRLSFFLIGILGTAAPAAAQGAAAPLRLTLQEAISRAQAASHRVGELRAREDGARAVRDGRRAAGLPQVSVQAGYMRTNHVDEFGIALPNRPFQAIYPDIPDNYRARLDLQWPIYSFGRTTAHERLAQAELEASGTDIETARADLALEVTRAFWAVVTAGEAVRVLEQSLKRMDAAVFDMQNRLAVGLIPPSDVLSMQAQRSRQQMLLVQARNQREVMGADLARLVGVAPDAAIEPAASLDQAPLPQAAVEALVTDARQARPERQALLKRLAAADQRHQAAQSNTRPIVAVGAGFDYARPNPRIFPRVADWRTSWDASVSFSWLLWDGGRVKADIADAAAGARALRERLAEFDRVLEVDVRQRWLDLQSARAAIEAATESVKAATEARRVVSERYQSGVATSTDVLDAQVALLQAELDRTQALANSRLAEARLARAVGKQGVGREGP